MGQKNSKNYRKSDLSNLSKLNFGEYYQNHRVRTSEDVPESTSPILKSLNLPGGYIKANTIKPHFIKNKVDEKNLSQSSFTQKRSSNSSVFSGLKKSMMTSSTSDLQQLKNENFQIKNIFRAEDFQKIKEPKSFFKRLSKKQNNDIDPKISINDVLNYKPGRRIFFTHTNQINQNTMKNPFEEIRVPQLEKKPSFFHDDMAIKIEKEDKFTPEEKNLPSPYYQIRKESIEKKSKVEQKFEISLEEDTINENQPEDPLDKKYKSLGEELIGKVKEANESTLEGFDKIYEDYENDYRLQIFMKTYVTKEKNRVNIFRSQFIVPCDPEYFLRFMNNIPEQSQIDKHLDQFYIVKEIFKNLNVIFLSYKKVLISSPRELIYLKAIKEIDHQKNIWCDASQSIEVEGFPIKNGIIRAEIILSGHMVCPCEENKGKSIVRLYSEVDFKTNVPIFLSKSFSINEMKKYTGECIKRIKEMKNT